MKVRAWILVAVGAVAWAGCGGGADTEEVPGPGQVSAGTSSALPPPGHGTLRQDAFTVSLRVGDVLIKATPLAEEVVRLAAPDTYERLREIAATNRPRAREAARRAGSQDEPLLFLVSFHTFAPRSEYTPTDLQILSQGRLHRPLEILPITPGFGTQLLPQEQTQIAVYAFDASIDLSIPLTVRYGAADSGAWEAIIAVLEAERARVLARTKGEGTG